MSKLLASRTMCHLYVSCPKPVVKYLIDWSSSYPSASSISSLLVRNISRRAIVIRRLISFYAVTSIRLFYEKTFLMKVGPCFDSEWLQKRISNTSSPCIFLSNSSISNTDELT
jgi:hypothetical protein